MRIRGLTLVALFVVLVACAEKPKPPETVTTSPPVVTVEPSAPARRESPPPSAPPPAPTPSPVGPTPSPSPPTAPPRPERSTTTSVLYISVQRANFREGPDVKAKILSVLTRGTKLTVLEKSAQWYRVRLDDGKEGWVAESVTSAKPN